MNRQFNVYEILHTFFSRCGDTLSSTELKLCNGEFRSLPGLVRDPPPPFTKSPESVRAGATRLVGDVSRRSAAKPASDAVLLIGEIVRSGDSVMRCVIILTGELGESMFSERARVSAISRRACSRNRTCRSSCVR